jgi:hypothetical protein
MPRSLLLGILSICCFQLSSPLFTCDRQGSSVRIHGESLKVARQNLVDLLLLDADRAGARLWEGSGTYPVQDDIYMKTSELDQSSMHGAASVVLRLRGGGSEAHMNQQAYCAGAGEEHLSDEPSPMHSGWYRYVDKGSGRPYVRYSSLCTCESWVLYADSELLTV